MSKVKPEMTWVEAASVVAKNKVKEAGKRARTKENLIASAKMLVRGYVSVAGKVFVAALGLVAFIASGGKR